MIHMSTIHALVTIPERQSSIRHSSHLPFMMRLLITAPASLAPGTAASGLLALWSGLPPLGVAPRSLLRPSGTALLLLVVLRLVSPLLFAPCSRVRVG